jgi:hypothetical protein
MAQFDVESNLQLHHFLSKELIAQLEPSLLDADLTDGLDSSTRNGRTTPHSAGVSGSWTAQGPPHKWRYCTLGSQPTETASQAEKILRQLQEELFPSAAFRAWLCILTRLIPLSHSVEARRFRPGLDYTLATSEDDDSRLDVVLGLTPQVKEEEEKTHGKAKAKEEDEESTGWQSGGWGGWEVNRFLKKNYQRVVSDFLFSVSVIWLLTARKMILPCIDLALVKSQRQKKGHNRAKHRLVLVMRLKWRSRMVTTRAKRAILY